MMSESPISKNKNQAEKQKIRKSKEMFALFVVLKNKMHDSKKTE